MKIKGAKKFTVVLCSLLLLHATPLHATESVDCSNDTYSIQVVCGSEDCPGFNFYVGADLQDGSNWHVDKADVNTRTKRISLLAKSTTPAAEDIVLSVNGKRGTLRLGHKAHPLTCDWRAFAR